MKNKEILKYTVNKHSYVLILLAIVINTLFLILNLNAMNVEYSIGIYILSNILITMLWFLLAVKIQTYDKLWTYIAIGFAAYSSLRILMLPQGTSAILSNMTVISYVVTSVLLLWSALVSLKKIKEKSDAYE